LPVEQGLLGTQPPPVCDCRGRATVHAGTGHGQLMLHTQRRCDPCPPLRNTADVRRSGSTVAEIVPAASPVAPSSKQELHILKLVRARKNSPRDCRRVRNQSSNPAHSPAPHRPEAADSQSPGTGAARHSAQVGLTSYRSFDHWPSARLEISLDLGAPRDDGCFYTSTNGLFQRASSSE
jgi:hypothetical protein